MGRKTVYLINPKNDFPNYYGGEVFGHDLGRPGVAVSDLAVTTVATLMRPFFNVILCEEHVDEVDYSLDVDFVALTGKITQWSSAKRIAVRFRELGIPVIIGGPFASLSPGRVRPYADILITGELEEIAEEVFAEISSGNWRDHYTGDQVDMNNSVIPSWDLYPNHRSITGNLQTSRGCPFQCEFCDVIQYLGRKQRHKPVGNILKELDYLHKIGYRSSFISDDNFTVYRNRVKEVLSALEEWNKADSGRTHKFTTQVSMDVTRDEELLDMLNRAGFSGVFIGIETPNEASLKETRKLQNTNIDLVQEIEKLYAHGISVFSGMIVGFDHDDTSIFERQFDFAMRSSIPFFSLNYLFAFETTPLYTKLRDKGRIKPEKDRWTQTQFSSNVRMKSLSEDEQYYGMRWLVSNIYAPQHFGERLCRMIDLLGPARVQMDDSLTNRSVSITHDLIQVVRNLKKRGEAEKEMINRVMRKVREKPYVASTVWFFLFTYAQTRDMLDCQPPGREMYIPDEISRPALSMS